MILDLEKLDDRAIAQPFDCDLCIIGSGAAGMALALEFINSKFNTVILESGGKSFEPPTQDLYDSQITGHPYVSALDGRYRILGGSTTRWGGQVLPMTAIDFEKRDWISHSGWPISFDEVARFYPRAERVLQVDTTNYDTDIFAQLKFHPPKFDAERVHYHYSKWCPQSNLFVVHGRAIESAANMRLLLHANVTQMKLNDARDHLSEIEVRTLDNRAAKVRAKLVILAAGGIETARLLLVNDLANQSGLVGKFFQDHPGSWPGKVRPRNMNELQRLFNMRHRRGQKFLPRLTASDDLQRREKILGASALVSFQVGRDSPYQAIKSVYTMIQRGKIGGELLRKMLFCALHMPQLIKPVYEFYAHGQSFSPDASCEILMLTEQEPFEQSCIRLSDQVDALGMRRSDVHWKLTDLTVKSCRAHARAMRDEFDRFGFGTVELADWVENEQGDVALQHFGDMRHHMGTARMSDSPHAGVVDRDCKSHHVDNLYIAGSAVFPTGGHSNPTLTLIALAIRLADHLKSSRQV